MKTHSKLLVSVISRLLAKRFLTGLASRAMSFYSTCAAAVPALCTRVAQREFPRGDLGEPYGVTPCTSVSNHTSLQPGIQNFSPQV